MSIVVTVQSGFSSLCKLYVSCMLVLFSVDDFICVPFLVIKSSDSLKLQALKK